MFDQLPSCGRNMMRIHKWQVWSKLNKKINEMLATFIYSIGNPVTRPTDSRVKNCHQFHHRADGGLRYLVKSCSLVFTRIRKLFKAETLIGLVKTWTWSQASLTFRMTAVVKHGHNLIFSPNKTFSGTFLLWQRGKWLINHGSAGAFVIHTNYQKWEQFALEKNALWG